MDILLLRKLWWNPTVGTQFYGFVRLPCTQTLPAECNLSLSSSGGFGPMLKSQTSGLTAFTTTQRETGCVLPLTKMVNQVENYVFFNDTYLVYLD